MSATQAFI
jgi:hypothetical protein